MITNLRMELFEALVAGVLTFSQEPDKPRQHSATNLRSLSLCLSVSPSPSPAKYSSGPIPVLVGGSQELCPQ